MSRLLDVSHTVENGMVTYEGLPGPVIDDYLSRAESRARYTEGTEFQIGKIEMVANTGTYLDSPFHRFSDGKDLSELALSSAVNLQGIVIHAMDNRSIDFERFRGIALEGKAVLVHTGWDRHWATENYFEGHPFLTRRAAQYLADAKAALVGIDSLNIDDTSDGTRPVHTILLGASIPIVEHLCNLSALPSTDFRFFAVPPKIKGLGSFPVRAFAVVE